jgi:hypothetical protein
MDNRPVAGRSSETSSHPIGMNNMKKIVIIHDKEKRMSDELVLASFMVLSLNLHVITEGNSIRGYNEVILLGSDAYTCRSVPRFRRNILSPASGLKWRHYIFFIFRT